MRTRIPTFRSPLKLIGTIFLCIGIFMIVVGIAVFLGVRTIDTEDARLASIITLSTVGGMGVLWFIAGGIISSINKRAERKLETLKDYGDSYEAEEVHLVSSNAVTINHSPAVYAECIYTNQSGMRCRVKSRLFMWRRWGQEADSLGAVIYVDRQDPSYYAVEMYYKLSAAGQVDMDFT